MKKGIEILTLALIGFLAIIIVLLWAVFQVGTNPTDIVERTEADMAISQLETAKRTVSDSLLFSSHQSAIDIAAGGGTLAGGRYWWCNGLPTPPEPQEVLWSMSNKTLSLYNLYVNATQNQTDVKYTVYDCAGVYESGEEICGKKDSSQCEYWNASATGGTLRVDSQNIHIFYDGNIVGEPKNNRFWWMYYILLKAARENLLVRAAQQGFQSRCTSDPAGNMRVAMDFAVDLLEKQFDEYVECSYKFTCGPDTTLSCLNEECKPEFNERLCFDVTGKEFVGLPVSAQGANQASAVIEVECIDHKFMIPTDRGTEELTWRFLAAITVGGECRPIDSAVA